MKTVSDLKPGDKIRHGCLELTVKGIWPADDGKTCILFEDIPSTDENSQAFQDLVRRTGGTGMMLPVKVENKGYDKSHRRDLLRPRLQDLKMLTSTTKDDKEEI